MTEFATKVKRVTARHHFAHLDVPKIEFGSPAAKTNDVVAARGRRPSIAPVPAMLGEDSSSSSGAASDSGGSQSGSESDTQPEVGTPDKALETTTESGHAPAKNGNVKAEATAATTTMATTAGEKFLHQKDQWTFPAERSL